MPDPTRNHWAREVRMRLAPLRLSPEREAEIVDELTQHLEDRWRELIAGGASPGKAEALVLADFSGPDALARRMAALRQSRVPAPVAPGAPMRHVLADLRHDLRYALRAMAAKPGFTAVAILSLALGIGANIAIFGVWNGVLHAALPLVRDPQQLVMLSDPDQSGSWTGTLDGVRPWLTYGEFEELRDDAESFSGVMASQSSLHTWEVRLAGSAWEEARGRLVSGGFFEVLGIRPAIGRLFTAAEDRSEADQAVISHAYWQRRFGGRPDALGATLTIRKTAFTIIGVAPRGFIGETVGQQPDLWLPLRVQPIVIPGRDRLRDKPPDKSMWLHVFGRLKPGVTHAQAETEANAIFRAGLASFYGATASGERRRRVLDQRLQLRPAARGASRARPAFSRSLTALLAAVGVLLLTACANLANLLLARGTARKAEMAIRLSLGASRGRLIRQLVTESLVLAACGGVAAVAVAYIFHGGLVSMMARSDVAFQLRFVLDGLVLAFAGGMTTAAALLFGVLPALQITRTDAIASIQSQTRGAIGSLGQLRAGRLLVSLQLALSLPLLVGAGLLARTVYNLQRADLGFPAEGLLLVRVNLREAGYEGARRDLLLRRVVEEFRRLPGVLSASHSQLGVFTGGESATSIDVEGYTPGRDEDRESAMDAIGPGYFATLGAPMRMGREFRENESGTAPVCLINEAFAKRFFDRRNPVGMHITLGSDSDRTSYEVVGIARDVRTQSLRGEVAPRFYLGSRPSSSNSPTLLIRIATEPGLVLAAARKAIRDVDPAIPIMSAVSIEEQMDPLLAQDRSTAQLAVVFGSVALALAAIGLYGVLSYGVARRTGEIAVRIALGAESGRVIAMILRETSAVVAIGLALGAGIAYGATRLIDSQLYGVAPQDPVTLTLATALLLVVALSAAYVPAYRASRVDPVSALRQS